MARVDYIEQHQAPIPPDPARVAAAMAMLAQVNAARAEGKGNG